MTMMMNDGFIPRSAYDAVIASRTGNHTSPTVTSSMGGLT